jgi:hypothetical protein
VSNEDYFKRLGEWLRRGTLWQLDTMGITFDMPFADLPESEQRALRHVVTMIYYEWILTVDVERFKELPRLERESVGERPERPADLPMNEDVRKAIGETKLHRAESERPLTEFQSESDTMLGDIFAGRITLGDAAARESQRMSAIWSFADGAAEGAKDAHARVMVGVEQMVESEAGRAALERLREFDREVQSRRSGQERVRKSRPTLSVMKRQLDGATWLLDRLGVVPDPPIGDALAREAMIVSVRVRQTFDTWKRSVPSEEAQAAEDDYDRAMGIDPAERPEFEAKMQATLEARKHDHPEVSLDDFRRKMVARLKKRGVDTTEMETHLESGEPSIFEQIGAASREERWDVVREKTWDLINRRPRSAALIALAKQLDKFEDGLPNRG